MAASDHPWEDLRARLARYVRAKVDVDVAEDLVHDILLRLLRNEKDFSTADSPVAWVYAVARNRIADYYRQQARAASTVYPGTVENDLLVEDGSFATEPDRELAECLRPLTARLAPKYEEALQLVDLEGLKQSEAAERAGISLSGMKARVQRARAKLKDELLACCETEQDRFGNVIDYEVRSDNGGRCCC